MRGLARLRCLIDLCKSFNGVGLRGQECAGGISTVARISRSGGACALHGSAIDSFSRSPSRSRQSVWWLAERARGRDTDRPRRKPTPARLGAHENGRRGRDDRGADIRGVTLKESFTRHQSNRIRAEVEHNRSRSETASEREQIAQLACRNSQFFHDMRLLCVTRQPPIPRNAAVMQVRQHTLATTTRARE
jgi:hypothetical protein